MSKYNVIKLQDVPKLKDTLANWFHEKWDIPVEAYIDSMNESLANLNAVPQWYVVLDGDKIIAGAGVIENDFHNRKDLRPNVCALYVEEAYRFQGIAGEILSFVCNDMKGRGIDTLYLITDHTSFYEKYDWEFLCMVQGDEEAEMMRMYIHKEF